MECAPVLVITLNRYEHFKRCIESLKNNPLAKNTDLYIGLDYPPNARYQKGYEQIKDYIDSGVNGFREVIVIKHTVNQGSSENLRQLKNIAYKKYDRVIFSEDDNEFSMNFLEYMNLCFEKYENDESVLAVAGYNYPINIDGFRGNVFRYGTYFPAWGYGIWRKKELKMKEEINMNYFMRCYKSSQYMRKLSMLSRCQYANMVKGMLEYTPDLIKDNQIKKCDLSYGIYMVASGKQMIFPVESKVRNWGYDGTGVNCGDLVYDPMKKMNHRNYQYQTQKVDEKAVFDSIEECNVLQQQIDVRMNEFFAIPRKEYVKAKIAYLASRLLGVKTIRRLFSLRKRNMFERIGCNR